MIQINLLPKEYLKSKRSLSFGKSGMYVVAGGVAVVALLAGVTFWQMHQVSTLDENIARANQRAAMLRQDIQMVDALTDVKDKITKRVQAVERLDRHRTVWVRLLENVAQDVPEFVWLSEFRQTGLKFTNKLAPVAAKDPQAGSATPPTAPEPGKYAADKSSTGADTATVHPVEIEGYAFTLNAIAAFMIKLMQSDYFDNVELMESKDNKFSDDERAYQFTVSANAHYLSDEELRNLAAQADREAESASTAQSPKGLN
jgi:Tfp pilus assembly protein PilN